MWYTMKKMNLIPVVVMVILLGAVIIANADSCHGVPSGREIIPDGHEHVYKHGQEDAEADTDDDATNQYVEPVIPSFVQNLLEYAEWFTDTICVANGKAYYLAGEEFGRTMVIYDDERILVADPTLQVDSLLSGCSDKFYVSVADKSMLVNFSNPQSVRSMSSLSLVLPAFTRYHKDSKAGFGHNVLYNFTADFPEKFVPHADDIRKWLVAKIADSQALDENVPLGNALLIGYEKKMNGGWKYRGDLYNHQQIEKFASGLYFALTKGEYGTNDEDYPSFLFSTLSLEAKVQNSRFVTYQQCTHNYYGGIHGLYTQRLISYDHVHQQEIDFNYLFNPQCKQLLLKMLKEEAIHHPKCRNGGVNIDGAIYVTDEDGDPTGELRFPQPGLSENGVVFSFQPYEIDCFAAGVYRFTIPYDKVKPFLTPRGKWCLGL